MERTMRTVNILAGLACKAKTSNKEVEFLGFMIGSLAETLDALLEYGGADGDNAASECLTKLANLTLRECGEIGIASATVQ